MMILALALVPLVTGLPQNLVSPYHAAGYPYQVVGSPVQTTGSLYQTVGSPHQTLGSPYQTVGSPYQTFGSPYQTVGSPYQSVGSPYHSVSSPYQVQSFSHQAAPRSHYQVVGSHYPVVTAVNASPHLQRGFPYLTSVGIIQQTRQQTDSLKLVLRNLANNPTSAKYIRRVLDSSRCINSLEGAIEAIEAGVKLVENAGPEVLTLVATVKSLENEKDIERLVRTSADVLRQMEILIPKIAPVNPTVCGTSPEATFEALQNVAQILDDVSEDQSLYLSEVTKNEVKRTATIVYGVTTFIKQLGSSFNKFKQACTADKQYNLAAISSIGDMMENLADLFGVLGGFEDAEQIREKAEFTKKVVDAINQLGDFDLGNLECNRPGSFEATAAILEDVANLIDEVGLENLKKQLGLNLDF